MPVSIHLTQDTRLTSAYELVNQSQLNMSTSEPKLEYRVDQRMLLIYSDPYLQFRREVSP